MRKYAEIHRGFVVGFHDRPDERKPEFVAPRFVVRIDDLPSEPAIGDEWDGRRFTAPTRPNPNLDPPPPADREILEETRATVERILQLLQAQQP